MTALSQWALNLPMVCDICSTEGPTPWARVYPDGPGTDSLLACADCVADLRQPGGPMFHMGED